MNVLAIDIEHSYGPMRPYEDGFYISCIGIVRSDGVREMLWVEHEQRERSDLWDKRVQEHIDWADIVVAHNLKHDMTILRYYAISFEKVALHCTMLTEYLLSGQDTRSRTMDLSAVCEHYGKPRKLDKVAALWAKKIDTYYINSDLLEEYCYDDTQKCLDLYQLQTRMVDEEGMRKIVDLQNEFTFSLSDMELYGFDFDKELAQEMVDKYQTQMDKIANEIRDIAYRDMIVDPNDELIAEFNPSSDVQRSALLFGGEFTIDGKEWTTRELKHETKFYQKNGKIVCRLPGLWAEPPTKKRNQDGSVPVDKSIVKKLRCKTPDQKIVKSGLTEYAKIKKAKETLKGKSDTKGLLNKFGTDRWIHPNLNQCVTVTGRLSGSDPNTQNMPRGSTSPLKKCIRAKLDEIMQVDLSQIEWRCAAWLSQDPVMIQEINNDIDQHTRACVELMELPFSKDNRTKAKVFNFRMIYGGVAYGYYMDDNMPPFPLKRWEKIVDGFWAKYTGLDAYNYHNIQLVQKYGELRLPTGRRFKFHKDGHEYAERQIKNYPVQGMAGGDILPLLAVMIRRGMKKAGLNSHMILTVHDSIVFDVCKKEKDQLIELVTKCVQALGNAVARYYDIRWNVKLNAEYSFGNTYGDLGKEVKV